MNSSVGLLEHKILPRAVMLLGLWEVICRDGRTIKQALDDVLQELGMPVDSAQVETAMGAPEGEAVQVRFTDESTGGKAVAVTLRDTEGRQLVEEGLKQRLREQIATFRRIDEM